MDKGTRKIYRNSKFYQRIFFRSEEYEIDSVVGQTITTKTPHCLDNGDRVVLWFKGCDGAVFKTLATVSSGNTSQFTVADSIPDCFEKAFAFCPVSLTGTPTAKIYGYPQKSQALSGKITCENGSNVAIISDSVAFEFTNGMTLSAGAAFNAIAIEDWHSVPEGDQYCGSGQTYTHTLVLASNAGASIKESPYFSISGEDRRNEVQSILEYTQSTFTGDLTYGEIAFEIPVAEINALTRGDHLLQVALSDNLLYHEQLTFEGADNPKDRLDFDESTHSIELLGGNSIAPGDIVAPLIRVGAAFTIPASGGVTVAVTPSDAFVDGQSENVVIRQVVGVLSRSGSNYTFTRNDSGSSLNVAQNNLISILGDSVFDGLAPDSQGLSLANKELGLLPTGDNIDLHSRNVFDLTFRPSAPDSIRHRGEDITPMGLAGISLNGKAPLFGYIRDGKFTLFFEDFETPLITNIPYPNNLDMIAGYAFEDGKVPFGIKRDGSLIGNFPSANGVGSAFVFEGIEYYTQTIDLQTQVARRYGMSVEGLTPLGGFAPVLLEQSRKILFYSVRDGGRKLFQMDLDGGNQFYANHSPEHFAANTYYHLVGNGQSLSEGQGSTAQTTTQLYNNVMFSGGIAPGTSGIGSFIPAIEQSTERGIINATHKLTKYVRGITSGASDSSITDNIFVISHVGVGARSLAEIRKNPTGTNPTNSYANAIAQFTAAKAIADSQSKGYKVLGQFFTHGESDDAYFRSQSPNYAINLKSFYDEYNADIKAITGQTEDMRLFISQMSSHTRYNFATPYSAIQQYNAWESDPEQIILVCPKYWIPYSDGVHSTTQGYQALNEMYAEAYGQTFYRGQTWKPLYPQNITRSGAVVTVDFYVPVGDLVIDTAAVSDPGDYGFEYFNSGGSPISINSVAVGNDRRSVVITLASASAGFLAYAYTGTPGAAAGATTGARGCLRDQANYKSISGIRLSNWCVHFYKAVA